MALFSFSDIQALDLEAMCIMYNKPTPSGFPMSLMSYVQLANVLVNLLGGVGLFHMIYIA